MNISLTCPSCDETFDAEAKISHDPGCRYTSNGDGWPESTEVDWDELPDLCPTCGHVWEPEEVQAFDERAVEYWRDGIDDAYMGPTEPEDRYDD